MIHLYKYQGETPLQALDRLRIEMPQYKDATLSYAGRLDPLAEGLMLVLVDTENNERAQYLNLDKEYIIEVLLGVATDTGDLLGKVLSPSTLSQTAVSVERKEIITKKQIEEVVKKYITTFEQNYPAYSSQPVQGKPLHQWAREGKLSEITIPTREVTIYSADVKKIRSIITKDLLTSIKDKLQKVRGDFRQAEIITTWEEFFNQADSQTWNMVAIQVKCSSGTYMRAFAQNIGQDIGRGACIYSIIRTRVGEHMLELSTSR
jgi:tRNA pseudouridine55 synthase